MFHVSDGVLVCVHVGLPVGRSVPVPVPVCVFVGSFCLYLSLCICVYLCVPSGMQMMRNADRAMSNAESMPGGFDALLRMQNEITNPLMDAFQAPPQAESESQEDKQEEEEDGGL